MNKEFIFQSMEHIDPDLIDEAETYRSAKKKNTWVKWSAVAACLCLAVVGTIFWQKTATPVKEDTGIILSEDGVTIPKINISLSANSSESADMVGFFIYHGNCYVQNDWLYDADIVGEYLGTATGLIDEWTAEDGYVELAGSVQGDFFAVKGYDPAFMLCMKCEGEVSTYICDNGITLKYGSELYEDRLHLSGNYSAVQYETRKSWYYSENDIYQLNGNDEVIGSFIEQMDRAEFILWDDAAAQEGLTGYSMIDEAEIYHVYFRMTNGTTVHLRLYENGYVRFQGLWDICVKVPEESFNPLVDLMRNHTDAEPVDVSVGGTDAE